jgi:hypothetical protein
MQTNIVHRQARIPSANALIQEAYMCAVCKCSRGGQILPHEPAALYGQYIYDVWTQMPGYPFTNSVQLCPTCHLKVVHRINHDCSRCEDGEQVSCKGIMGYLQSQTWNVCTAPQCHYCI